MEATSTLPSYMDCRVSSRVATAQCCLSLLLHCARTRPRSNWSFALAEQVGEASIGSLERVDLEVVEAVGLALGSADGAYAPDDTYPSTGPARHPRPRDHAAHRRAAALPPGARRHPTLHHQPSQGPDACSQALVTLLEALSVLTYVSEHVDRQVLPKLTYIRSRFTLTKPRRTALGQTGRRMDNESCLLQMVTRCVGSVLCPESSRRYRGRSRSDCSAMLGGHRRRRRLSVRARGSAK
jgi:hypothetical protein